MSDLLEERRELILSVFYMLPPQLWDAVIEELAELDAANDTTETSLMDAGHGSGGVM